MFLNDIKYDWIGDIPDDWEIKRIKNLFFLKKEVSDNPQGEEVLSLTMDGIIKRDISSNEGQLPETYKGYTKIYPDDIVMNPMDLKSGWVDRSKYDGIISPSYYVLNKLYDDLDIEFFNYQLQRHYKERIFFSFGQGVSYDYRWGLGRETILNFPIIVPPFDVQTKIVSFLDTKTQKIDELIKRTEQKIEILKKSIPNYFFYLKKENKIIDMKELWFQKKPSNWRIIKLRELFDVVSERNHPNERLLSVHQSKGVIYRDEQLQDVMNPSGDLSNYKLVKPGDFIISLRSSEGGFEYSEVTGLVSPVYTVLRPKFEIDTVFYKFLFKTHNFIVELNRFIKGIRDGKNINFIDIRDVLVPVPSFFDSKIHETHLNILKSFLLEEIKIGLLKEYRQSLISEVVTNKIDVRDWKE